MLPTTYSIRQVFNLLERLAAKKLGGGVSPCGKYFSFDHQKLIVLLIKRLRECPDDNKCLQVDARGQTTLSLVWSADGTVLGNNRALVCAGT